MSDRRKLLAPAALPAMVLGTSPQPVNTAVQEAIDCGRAVVGPRGIVFPNAVVTTHEGQRARFYDDLVRDKLVMINFMSIEHDPHYPVTENLVKVARLFGRRLGREVHMLSVTTDPQNDSPRALRAFAGRYGVPPGWQFLTGEPSEVATIKTRFFMPGPSHAFAQGDGPAHDCSVGLVRYGNAAVDLWGSVPAKTDPLWIVQRLSWVASRPQPSGRAVRRGPVPMEV